MSTILDRLQKILVDLNNWLVNQPGHESSSEIFEISKIEHTPSFESVESQDFIDAKSSPTEIKAALISPGNKYPLLIASQSQFQETINHIRSWLKEPAPPTATTTPSTTEEWSANPNQTAQLSNDSQRLLLQLFAEAIWEDLQLAAQDGRLEIAWQQIYNAKSNIEKQTHLIKYL